MDPVGFLQKYDPTLFVDFSFNASGHHSPKHAFKHLNEDEVKHVSVLLRSERHHRHIGQWIDVGDHKEPIRMLLQGNKVYAVFKLNEHVEYEKMLDSKEHEFRVWEI